MAYFIRFENFNQKDSTDRTKKSCGFQIGFYHGLGNCTIRGEVGQDYCICPNSRSLFSCSSYVLYSQTSTWPLDFYKEIETNQYIYKMRNINIWHTITGFCQMIMEKRKNVEKYSTEGYFENVTSRRLLKFIGSISKLRTPLFGRQNCLFPIR